MRTALTSDEELARCQARIAEFKKLGRLPDGVDDEAMWEAQRTVNAIIHGPTGEKMFLPGHPHPPAHSPSPAPSPSPSP